MPESLTSCVHNFFNDDADSCLLFPRCFISPCCCMLGYHFPTVDRLFLLEPKSCVTSYLSSPPLAAAAPLSSLYCRRIYCHLLSSLFRLRSYDWSFCMDQWMDVGDFVKFIWVLEFCFGC